MRVIYLFSLRETDSCITAVDSVRAGQMVGAPSLANMKRKGKDVVSPTQKAKRTKKP